MGKHLSAGVSRPGVFLFLVILILSLAGSWFRLGRMEKRVPGGPVSFSGRITDPGHVLPGDETSPRYQKLVLSDGTPVMLFMRQPARRGDQVEGIATFRAGEGSRNPGGFSERNWLWTRGAAWVARVASVRLIPQDGIWLWVRRLPDRLRDNARLHRAGLWTSRPGSLLLSLSLGDTRLLGDDRRYFLRASGLSHLTSVSGTHLAFLLNPALWLTRKVKMSRRAGRIVTLPLILLPGLLSGWRSGISRASLVALAARLDLPAGKRRDPFNLLFLAGSIMLAANPFAVYERGFWMSLSASGAVSYAASRLSVAPLTFAGRRWPSSLAYTLAAQLAVLPYQVAQSPGIQLLAPLANLVALPLAACLTALTYPILLVLSLIPPQSRAMRLALDLCEGSLGVLADLFERLARAVARSHLTLIPLGVCLLALPLVPVLLKQTGRLVQIRLSLKVMSVLSAIWMALIWVIFIRVPADRMVFLDVGQGDASLFISREGPALLIDGGDQGSGYDVVLAAAGHLSAGPIELAVVTHGHRDHAAGVCELIEAGFVRQVCLPDIANRTPAGPAGLEEDLTQAILDLAQKNRIPVTRLKAGDVISVGRIKVEVLYPEAGQSAVDLNECSLVMRVTLGGLSVLMTGDLTEAGERALLSAGIACDAQLLHLAHHGSKYSSSASFLDAVSPQMALLSSGLDNRYGHPHGEVLDRLQDRKIGLARTDQGGAIFLKVKGGKGTMKTWLKVAQERSGEDTEP